jgi:hypothetical protein
MVRMTTSTVTANAGKCDGSYPAGTRGSTVLVNATFTVSESYRQVDKNSNGSMIAQVRIDLDFDVMTVDGGAFPATRLLGRPTILILLRYLG